jgi:hypothetical protein
MDGTSPDPREATVDRLRHAGEKKEAKKAPFGPSMDSTSRSSIT